MGDTPERPGQLSTLNGLRGVAAICVVLFHRAFWFGPHFLLPNASMAVEFFFILSGFVVARAYTVKVEAGMGFRAFMGRRLQRLYPLALAGVLVGALSAFVKLHGHADARFGLNLLATLAILPAPWEPLSWQLNPPLWSLFFEIVVNAAFAVLLLRGRMLWLVVGLAGVAYLLLANQVLIGNPTDNTRIGLNLLSVTFLFYLGVLLEKIHDKGLFRRVRLGLLPGSVLLVLSFMGNLTGHGVVVSLIAVFFVYPLIVIGGANQEPMLRKTSDALGELSYPLYVLHFPLLSVLAAIAMAFDLPKEPATWVGITVRLLAIIGLSWGALKLCDEPFRRWLTERLKAGPAAAAEAVRA